MRNLFITTYISYKHHEKVHLYHFDETGELFYALTSEKILNIFSLKGKKH